MGFLETLTNDLAKYTKALNSPPNAWGQHIVDGMQSHAFLMLMWKRHGREAVNRALDDHFALQDRINALDLPIHYPGADIPIPSGKPTYNNRNK